VNVIEMHEDMVASLSNTEKRVILILKDLGKTTPEQIMKEGKFEQMIEIMNATSWLRSKGLVETSEEIITHYSLSKKQYASKELPERRALRILKKNRGIIGVDELKSTGKLRDQEVGIAIGWMKRKGWAKVSKRDGEAILEITEKGTRAVDKKGEDEMLIDRLGEGDLTELEIDKNIIDMLKSRQNLIKERESIKREISLTELGKNITTMNLELKEQITQLTPELLQTGKWRDVEIRKYDINTFAPTIHGGMIHPLQWMTQLVRKIFLEMGFTEIEYDLVQSTFWTMDALFTAQDHPVRDMQDTFYLSKPEKIDLPEEKIVERVKVMHEEGGDIDSTGWRYEWDAKEAEKAILRTHTTVNTIRYLSEHQEPPVKVFSVGRVFRREAIDSTHLPEFQQIEGIVLEEEANLRMLIGILREFYKRLGFQDLRIRPGYFPYTEPSLEVEIKLGGKWLEFGGAGIFRPEVTHPLGVKHPVLAWGLSLERLVMLKYGIEDMRKLYFNDLEWIRNAPLF
jgi:phenylalanyl-tRNA synthetase alpha chain